MRNSYLLIAALVCGFTISSSAIGDTVAPGLAIGQTRIAKWQGDKQAAFCMIFDDSKVTQADHAVPALIQRDLIGTFFVNPGGSQYHSRRRIWEEICPATGQELANHTMHHIGARNFTEADYEIGECARTIWQARPEGASPLLAFAGGGGTSWDITRQQWQQLLEKYHCIRRSSWSMTNADSTKMISMVTQALDKGSWVSVHFHGIGGQGLSVELPDFLALLDHLVSVREKIWVAGYTAVLKYDKQRDSTAIEVLQASDDSIRLKLSSDLDHVIYDQPLTLITSVPADWKNCTVTQGDNSTVVAVKPDGTVQFDTVPGHGEVTLRKSQTPPNGRPKAVIQAGPCSGQAPIQVAFSGCDSTDPESQPLKYNWDFGDDASATGETVSHVYRKPGTYLATLSVTDGAQTSKLDAVIISANTNDANELQAQKAAGSIKLDGRLDEPEWPRAHTVTFRVPWRSDNTATVSAVWTDTHLYFSYTVLDDYYTATGESLSADDGAEVRLDIDHDGGSVIDGDDYKLIATAKGKHKPPGIEVASAPIEGGYTMEIAVSWEAMKAKPAPGKRMGLFLSCLDRDPGASVSFDWPGLREIYPGYEPNLWGDLLLKD